MEQVLTQEQIDERVCVLKRLKELLQQQRVKFQEYLTVLEKQEFSITDGDAQKLTAHTQLEENILNNLQSLQKSYRSYGRNVQKNTSIRCRNPSFKSRSFIFTTKSTSPKRN